MLLAMIALVAQAQDDFVLAKPGELQEKLPATPLVILSAFCFARSSPALYDRLLASRAFGKAIRDWRAERAISRTGKAASVAAMAGFFDATDLSEVITI